MNIRNPIILLALVTLVIAGVLVFTLDQSDRDWVPAPAPTDDSFDDEPAPIPEPGKDATSAYKDLIRVDEPLPESTVSSPLVVRGAARGNWFFEASFPVVLTDWDGRIIAEGLAQAEGDWMTSEYVPFTAELSFVPDIRVSDRGALILRKSNPSGLPEYDDVFEFTIHFAR